MLEGLQALEEQLLRSVRAGRFPHAHIFEGPFGCGKKTLVDALCRALNCTGANPPCGLCPSCLRYAHGNAVNLLRLSPEKSAKVEEIRDLIERVAIRPFDGGRLTVVLENADRLTAQAQNALLKTLEEPPEYAVFFLIVERMSALLSTIVSRCAVHHVHPLEEEDCAQVLRERGVDPQQAPLLARAAQGSVGRALQIASDEAYMNDVRAVDAALDGIRAASDVPAAALALADEKRDAARTLELVEGWARARLLEGGALDGGRLLGAVADARMKLASNVSRQYAMELMLFAGLGKRNG